MSTVVALFVDPKGIYSTMPKVDCWGEDRDARKYPGDVPVVAHPPCSAWCKMAPINEARYGHPVGDDGGCFESALAAVREFGGVLEHPAGSYAWPVFGLNPPLHGGWSTAGLDDPGWVCRVEQGVYGHRARKATWLYAVGCDLPSLDWSSAEPTAWVSYCMNHGTTDLPRLSKREASATPPAFAEILVEMARSAA